MLYFVFSAKTRFFQSNNIGNYCCTHLSQASRLALSRLFVASRRVASRRTGFVCLIVVSSHCVSSSCPVASSSRVASLHRVLSRCVLAVGMRLVVASVSLLCPVALRLFVMLRRLRCSSLRPVARTLFGWLSRSTSASVSTSRRVASLQRC
jgi:hypothetical protein